MQFNVNRNNPLIQREQTYILDKSYITVHSEDRDTNKWKTSNEFEIQLPRDYKNVVSMRLCDISIPSNVYTFSKNNQNTKFRFTIAPQINDIAKQDEFEALEAINVLKDYYEVEINEGYYTPEELAYELQLKMNTLITNEVLDICENQQEISSTLDINLDVTYEYSNFKVRYNKSEHRIEFVNNRDDFALLFDEEIEYITDCNIPKVWEQKENWGFPYYIGYQRAKYIAQASRIRYSAGSTNSIIYTSSDKQNLNVYYVKSTKNVLNLNAFNTIYMEVDKYNNMDEIVPYSTKTNNTYGNDYSARVNSAFAKLIINENFTRKLHKNEELNQITIFKIPETNIRKLKFKFRFHNGNIVDFKNENFNFTIEINELKDEQYRNKLIENLYYL